MCWQPRWVHSPRQRHRRQRSPHPAYWRQASGAKRVVADRRFVARRTQRLPNQRGIPPRNSCSKAWVRQRLGDFTTRISDPTGRSLCVSPNVRLDRAVSPHYASSPNRMAQSLGAISLTSARRSLAMAEYVAPCKRCQLSTGATPGPARLPVESFIVRVCATVNVTCPALGNCAGGRVDDLVLGSSATPGRRTVRVDDRAAGVSDAAADDRQL